MHGEKFFSDIGSFLIGISFVISIFLFILFIVIYRTLKQIIKKERVLHNNKTNYLLTFITLVLDFLAIYGINEIIKWLYANHKYTQMISVQVSIVHILVIDFILLYSFYYIVTSFYKNNNKINFLTLIVNGVISGIGNTLVIYIINKSLNVGNENKLYLFILFIVCLIMHIVAERYIRRKIAFITNRIIFNKRIELIDKTLQIPFEKMEKFENGKINACLNNDTEKISEGMHLAITGSTNLITLFFCLVYLGILSVWGLILSIGVIIVTILLNLLVIGEANRLYEESRNIQNKFFDFINDMLLGLKELKVNKLKKKEFKEDFHKTCAEYRDKGTKVDLKFANAFVVEDVILLSVVGLVAFTFPFILGMEEGLLYNYVFIFLYMIGPVTYLLHSLPQIMQIHVSWKRINSLMDEVSDLEKKEKLYIAAPIDKNNITLTLKDLTFEYKNSDEKFSIGPINYTFKSGEITFITGGNGSGKSTLAKLLTGLYSPSKGELMINNVKISSDVISDYYSAIFSDFHLFESLYGINLNGREKEVNGLLELLKIQDKVTIKGKKFSSTQLSTGQKKRLALLVSYLEDKPICLFDEWAADQDPEYRRIFYHVLLPELKSKGKCIIAITHDDHYFDQSDHLIKMDQGKFIEK